MDDVGKLFNDLESNQTHEWEEAKRKFEEFSTQHKDQVLVNYMMDYFFRTGSKRAAEVLVRLQAPHDKYIFDSLADSLKSQAHRVQALNLFCYVIRNHPTWLYKIERHRLLKEVFRLMTTEKEIVPLMGCLLCTITLLPLIPNLVPNIIRELFEVFAHLASWKWQHQDRLSEDKLVHLQLGLQMLFYRLYGMYPNNFLAYLSDFTRKEKGAVFHHTLKPLLESVRVHPMLVMGSLETEITPSRWKEMEPHDVVVECARLSLPVIYQDINPDQRYHINSTDLLDTPGDVCSSSVPSFWQNDPYRSGIGSISQQLRNAQHLRSPVSRFDIGGSIWSPSNDLPKSGPIPLTPTPYTRQITAPLVNNQMLGVTGSSPPEAAVEATPETTPMKDISANKHSYTPVYNPHAVRAICLSSQPSSPMRRDQTQQFNFPPELNVPSVSFTGMPIVTTSIVDQDVNMRLLDKRVQQMLQDRTQSQSPFQTIEVLSSKHQGYNSPIDRNYKSDSPDVDSDVSSKQPTNSTPTTTPIPLTTPIPTPVEHITKMCDDCNETERSLCTDGGLQIATSRSMQLLAKRLKKRNRITSYCCNDTNSHKLTIGSKGGVENELFGIDFVKIRRVKSCSSISFASTIKIEDVLDENVNRDINGGEQYIHERRLQKSSKMLAIPIATKKVVSELSVISKAHVQTQTVQFISNNYEDLLYELLLENNELRKKNDPAKINKGMVDQYIATCSHLTRQRENIDVEQNQLLHLQLQYEQYRREIHAERTRRLMGRSREKRSLEMDRDRLREQLNNFSAINVELSHQIDNNIKLTNEREKQYLEELTSLKQKYQYEVEQNNLLHQANENLQTRLNEELDCRKKSNYELGALRGQIFNLSNELQQAQSQIEMGLQCKQELARLEAEFIVMGEIQIKCRDRLADIDNYRARDEELQMLQESYNLELKDLKHSLEEKTSHLDSARHKISELQAQLISNERVITEQKRLLKTVKDEYEEKFKALNKKYEAQKTIIMQMEERIEMNLHKTQPVAMANTCSPDTDKTDAAFSMDRNSPLSTSHASSESLSASLRSTEMRNLQQIVEPTISEVGTVSSSGINVIGTGASIIEGTRLPTLDLAASANSGIASAINIVHPSSSVLASTTAQIINSTWRQQQ